MKAKAYTTTGKARSAAFELPEAVFDGTVNEAVLHQVVTAHQANQRQGTHSTKTRNTIRGGGAKPWRQKGTGRARAGTRRSPLWRGGAVVFGPLPRSYSPKVPRQMRRLAIRSALNARANEGDLVVVEPFALEEPRTKALIELFEALEVAPGNVLILTDGMKREVYLSARNLPGVEVRAWGQASAYDVLWSDLLIVEESALTGGDRGDASAGSEEES
jgi:large subunit ribosomal protein L4